MTGLTMHPAASVLVSLLISKMMNTPQFSEGNINVIDAVCEAESCLGCWQRPSIVQISSESPMNITTTTPFPVLESTLDCCISCCCNGDINYVYGKHCEQTETVFSTHLEHLMASHFTCVYPQLRPEHKNGAYPSSTYPYYVNQNCPGSNYDNAPSDVDENIIKDKCENADAYADLDTKVPVSDMRTGLTYMNRYCAQCHDIPDPSIVDWSVKIDCFTEAYWPKGYDSVVTEIQHTRSCNILYGKPENIDNIAQCKGNSDDKCVIEKNATCYTASDSSDTVCYLTNDLCKSNSVRPRFEFPRGHVIVPFALLLRYKPPEEKRAPNHHAMSVIEVLPGPRCGTGTYHDTFKNVCRNLTCIPPKALLDGACQTLLEIISGAAFQVALKMTPKQAIPIAETPYISKELFYFGNSTLTNMSAYWHPSISLYVKSSETYDGAEVWKNVVYFVLHINVTIPSGIAVSAQFIDRFLEFDGTAFPISGHEFLIELIQVARPPNCNNSEMYNIVDNDILTLDLHKAWHNSANTVLSFTVLLTTSGCPLVTLETKEFEIQTFSWGITIQEFEANISRWHFLENFVSNELVSVMVCVETYALMAQSSSDVKFSAALVSGAANASANMINMTRVRDLEFSTTAGVLSLVCSCMSIFCSILTLLTYGFFKEMRTQPGLNNIALCISLICAQTLFQFGIGQKNHVPKWTCTTLGVLIHFFWLKTMMWMNVCSIHSFKVFRTINKTQNNRGSAKTTTLYFLYAALFAFVPVFANIVSSLQTERGDIGYGKLLCYISEKTLLLWTFALPAGIVISANIMLFVAVVIKVIHLPATGSGATKERTYLGVYFKLSSLTGFLWIFGFVYMFTGVTVLEYMFIVLNASQGVFIFASFVCNKSCCRKYLRLLTGYPISLPTTTKVNYLTPKPTQKS